MYHANFCPRLQFTEFLLKKEAITGLYVDFKHAEVTVCNIDKFFLLVQTHSKRSPTSPERGYNQIMEDKL